MPEIFVASVEANDDKQVAIFFAIQIQGEHNDHTEHSTATPDTRFACSSLDSGAYNPVDDIAIPKESNKWRTTMKEFNELRTILDNINAPDEAFRLLTEIEMSVQSNSLSPGIINSALLRGTTTADWERLGFVQTPDDNGFPFPWWDWTNDQYRISIDTTGVVSLIRLDLIGGDTDAIKPLVDNVYDLKCLIDWVQP